MQYNQKHSESHIPHHLFDKLKLKTKEEVSIFQRDNKNKLPPIFSSKNIFMISLIREEQNTNRLITNKKEEHSKMYTIASEVDPTLKDKHTILNSLQLKPKSGRIIFNHKSPQRVKTKHLLTSPTNEKSVEEENKVKKLKRKEEKDKQHRFYSKKREKNSLHLDKNSHSLVHLFERIESLKRLFDTKNNMFKREKQKDVQQRITEKFPSPSFFQKNSQSNHPHHKSEKMDQKREVLIQDVKGIETSRKTIRQAQEKPFYTRDDHHKKVVIFDRPYKESLDNSARRKKKISQKWSQEEELNPWKIPAIMDFEEGVDEIELR